jgi:hypothetical protein
VSDMAENFEADCKLNHEGIAL